MKRFLLLLLAMVPSPHEATAADGPLSPEQALQAFDLEAGLRIELVAAEPLTADPCALAWDEQGRLFVAENRGYPLGGPKGDAVGSVALLEDTDLDGRMDKRTVFAAGLTFPNGLMAWRGGLLVTCAPDVFFFKDTNGDGQADVKEVVLTGFATNLTTQLRVNTPLLAPDGWVYLASGLSGGRITSPERPQQPPLELKGDLRFKPDTGEYEAVDGRSQFGQSFDDFGRRFGVFNRVQVQHFVLPSHYLQRNPALNFGDVLQNCPELVANPFMRGGGGAARIYPVSSNFTTADSHAGTFTAACAIHIYRSDGLPAEYQGHAFSCDPTGNLVHHDRLEPAGATFAAKRVRDHAEFVRSRDNWFRPCFLGTGPDGALYIADMYRRVIEHPEYLPAEIRKRTDFESGKGLGRIWKVTSANRKSESSNLKLANVRLRSLVAKLDSANAWRRGTAFRLFLEANNPSIASALKRSFPKLSSPAGASLRLHLLASLDLLDSKTLAAGLRSPFAGVREAALRLAEPRLKPSPELFTLALKLADDPDARVRFQCALSLGAADSDEVIGALARIALRGLDDRWTRAAVLSSVPDKDAGQVALLSTFLARQPEESEGTGAFLQELSRMMTKATPAPSLPAFLDWLLKESANAGFVSQAALVDGFAEAIRGAGADSGPLLRGSSNGSVEKLMRSASQIAVSEEQPLERRMIAVQLLGRADPGLAATPLLALLHTNAPPALEVASIRALAELEGSEPVATLFQPGLWRRLSPACREAVLSSVFSRPRHHAALLSAIESGAVPLSALDSNRRNQFKKSKDPAVRERANVLFAADKISDRMKAFEEAKAALSLKPLPVNGRQVFKRACANCHRLDGEGYAVGPDLFDIRNQPRESILLHVIIPEAEIAPNFANYTCEKKDGAIVSGILIADTPASITLRQGLGIEEVIARSDIVELAVSNVSLMPQDLVTTMTRQELADLIAYLRGER